LDFVNIKILTARSVKGDKLPVCLLSFFLYSLLFFIELRLTSLLLTAARRPLVGPMRLLRERGGELVTVCECVRDVQGRKVK